MKRARSANFSKEEKFKFLELVEKMHKVIQSKKFDTASLREKEVAWQKITAWHNATAPASHPYRTQDTLRNAWENLKRRSRKVAECNRSTAADSPKVAAAIAARVRAIMALDDDDISIANGGSLGLAESLDGAVDDFFLVEPKSEPNDPYAEQGAESNGACINYYPESLLEGTSEQDESSDEAAKEWSQSRISSTKSAQERLYEEKLRLIKIKRVSEEIEIKRKEELHELAKTAARQKEEFFRLAVERMKLKIDADRAEMAHREEIQRLEVKRKKKRQFLL